MVRTFETDARANTQVVAALLLTGLVVLGAGVVGVVAFDLGERYLEPEPPAVSLGFEYDEEARELTVRHRSGRNLDGDRVEFVSDGATLGTWSSEATVSAGDAITIGGVAPGQTVVVYWRDADGDRRELQRWRGRDG